MNKVVACLLLLIGFINGIKGMDVDPAEIIRVNIAHPSKVMEDLSRLSAGDLADYRDQKNNNLFHIMVQTLIDKQDESNYDQLQAGAKDLIWYLQQKGVKITEFNNASATPLLLLYNEERAPPTHKHDILIGLLEEYGAQPTYFSPAHKAKECLEISIGCCSLLLHIFTELFCCRSKRD